jgi:antitoxin (DNA-binding transcriptional repressor) of toxin-antitoxin stability system
MKEKIMQTTMAVEDIKVTLPELLDSLTPGDEVILTRNQLPVAKLVSDPAKVVTQRPAPGMFPGSIISMAPDFDEPLDEFKEYME